MTFTIEEITAYLKTQSSIENAIERISEKAILLCHPNCVDKRTITVEEYEVAIGMAKVKEDAIKANKSWMSCSPRWMDEHKESHLKEKTEYKICYWVNYGDRTTYGWFTVEQIRKWLTTPDLLLHTLGGRKES